MKFFTSARAKINGDSAVALGCFDGVHIGHSKIISETVKVARELSLTSAVWSFQAPPKSVLNEELSSASSVLTPKNEKRALIRKLDVDVLICVPFDLKIAKLSPREFFVDILLKRLNAKHIFCGFNYRFGYRGSGDVSLLRSLCNEFSVSLTVFDEITVGGKTVSSSAIRAFLASGEIERAQEMLGRPFSIRGIVKDGQHLGRTLGFPTVNQELPKDKATVKNGVYLTRVRLGRTTKFGVTNIGMRPTVEGKELVCETHILNYSGNLYGKCLTVEFLKFIRPERKFNSLDELSAQVHLDMRSAIEYSKGNNSEVGL